MHTFCPSVYIYVCVCMCSQAVIYQILPYQKEIIVTYHLTCLERVPHMYLKACVQEARNIHMRYSEFQKSQYPNM
jgi:hypothetical protein